MFKTKINWSTEIEYITTSLYAGKSLATLGKEYDVSRQRMKQIAQKFNLDIKNIKSKVNADKEEIRFQKYLKKWGERPTIQPTLYSAQRAKWRAKKANAVRQGIEFSVLFGDLVFPTHCPILGIELDYFRQTRGEDSISFDRLDPKKGYTKENTIVCSWRANRIKNDGSAEEHRLIYEFLFKKVV